MSQTNARFQGGGAILPQGASPGSINAGEKALILDADGIVKTQDAAGTKTAIAGASTQYFGAVSGAVTDKITLTVLGDADGNYDVEGMIVCGHAGATFAFEPNNGTTNLKSIAGDWLTGAAASAAWPVLGRSGANPFGGMALGDRFTFSGRFTAKTGGTRHIEIIGFLDSGTDNGFHMEGQWTDTSTNLTSIDLQSSLADGLDVGSYFRLKARGES